ncbi:MAG: hypothetical protein EB084_23205 [Proteobacteria bacterium]|nr:hypothetical protein [Pseudomonadota bacterium]
MLISTATTAIPRGTTASSEAGTANGASDLNSAASAKASTELYVPSSATDTVGGTPKPLWQGRHGQTVEQYQEGRSDAGKRISGDSVSGPRAYTARGCALDAPVAPGEKPEPFPLSRSEKEYHQYMVSSFESSEAKRRAGHPPHTLPTFDPRDAMTVNTVRRRDGSHMDTSLTPSRNGADRFAIEPRSNPSEGSAFVVRRANDEVAFPFPVPEGLELPAMGTWVDPRAVDRGENHNRWEGVSNVRYSVDAEKPTEAASMSFTLQGQGLNPLPVKLEHENGALTRVTLGQGESQLHFEGPDEVHEGLSLLKNPRLLMQ